MSPAQTSHPTRTTRHVVFGHTPDPDDMFKIHAIANDLIDTSAFRVEHVMQDIETLNRWAADGRLHVTSVSAHAYAHLADRYAIMSCGASVGDRRGPKVVARPGVDNPTGQRVGIPGTWTTAALLLEFWAGRCKTVVIPSDEMLEAVRLGKIEAGVIIDECQLTWESLGLACLTDLGQWWHNMTGLPLPLSLNVVRRDLGPDNCVALTRVLRDSIEHAMFRRDAAIDFAVEYTRFLDKAQTEQYVSTYVTADSLEMGDPVVAALEALYRRAAAAGILPGPVELDIIPSR